MQIVILIREFNGRLGKDDALLHAVPLGKGAGRDVADDDLQGHDADLAYHRLPVIQLLYEVGGHALLLQKLHQIIGHPVVDGALPGNGALFQAVQCGGVVLIGHDHIGGILCGKHLFGLALIELGCLLHFIILRISDCAYYTIRRAEILLVT